MHCVLSVNFLRMLFFRTPIDNKKTNNNQSIYFVPIVLTSKSNREIPPGNIAKINGLCVWGHRVRSRLDRSCSADAIALSFSDIQADPAANHESRLSAQQSDDGLIPNLMRPQLTKCFFFLACSLFLWTRAISTVCLSSRSLDGKWKARRNRSEKEKEKAAAGS